MRFSSVVRRRTAENCAICNRLATTGYIVPLYKDEIPFVCGECYSIYFHDVKKVESNLFVKYRPSDVYKDRYRFKHIFVSDQVEQLIVWPYIGMVLWLLCRLIYMAFPPRLMGDNPTFLRIVMALYLIVTSKEIVGSIFLFVRGMFRGMSKDRLILAACKIALYFLVLMIVLIYAIL